MLVPTTHAPAAAGTPGHSRFIFERRVAAHVARGCWPRARRTCSQLPRGAGLPLTNRKRISRRRTQKLAPTHCAVPFAVRHRLPSRLPARARALGRVQLFAGRLFGPSAGVVSAGACHFWHTAPPAGPGCARLHEGLSPRLVLSTCAARPLASFRSNHHRRPGSPSVIGSKAAFVRVPQWGTFVAASSTSNPASTSPCTVALRFRGRPLLPDGPVQSWTPRGVAQNGLRAFPPVAPMKVAPAFD
jgi:hypothetical protein